MSARPIIGVTGPDRGGFIAWQMTALAIRRSGATPVRITPGRQVDQQQLDGIVIGGGTDVDPFHYGEESAASDSQDTQRSTAVDWLVGLLLGAFRAIFATYSAQNYDLQRDSMEKDIINFALLGKLPILGICRGAQLMNVAMGGSLHQNIGHFYTEETGNIRSILPRKTITVSPQTRLHQYLNTGSCQVNALHKQSINELGTNIMVSAFEPSGVVQAIEMRDHPFFLGVQWHPEYMPQSRTQQGLFQGLAKCAMKCRADGG